MTPLAFILCLACKALPVDGQDTTPPTLPPGEEMFDTEAVNYGGQDLTKGPLVEGSEAEGSRLTVSLRPNYGLKKVTEMDTDEDGVFDERFTTEDLSPTKKRRMLEKRAGPDAPWVVDYDKIGEPGDRQGGGGPEACLRDIGTRFPQDLGAPRYGNAAVVIPYGGTGAGRCSEAQGAVLQQAFECVQRKVDSCLRPLNPGVAAQVRRLLTAKTQKAVVSCNYPCVEGGAQTATLGKGNAKFEAIELPPGIERLPPKMACEYLMHELLHAAGIAQSANHDSAGADTIYACARVCAGCSHATGAGEPDDHLDCATCASARNKGICGLKPDVAPERIPDEPASCGRLDGYRYTLAAGERHRVDVVYCDGTPAPPIFGPTQQASCIEKCPEGFTVAGTGAAGWCRDFRPPEEQGSTCKASEPLWLCTA